MRKNLQEILYIIKQKLKKTEEFVKFPQDSISKIVLYQLLSLSSFSFLTLSGL